MLIDYAREIADRIDVKQVGEMYGLEFNRAGFALCPFHDEDTPSFKVQNAQWCHCFGCGVNANAVTLTSELLGLDFQGAMRRLNDDFRLGFPLDRRPSLKERANAEKAMRERKERQRRRKAAKDEYETMCDLYAVYENAMRELAPKTPEEEAPALYVEAVTNIAALADAIDNCQWVREGYGTA